MKASPQGASVVPTVATATRTASRVRGMLGTTSPLAAAPQSGPARNPAIDVGDEDRAEGEQEVLDAAEALAQDEGGDADRREGHADVAAHPAEQLHPGRHPGELGAQRPRVGDDQRGHDEPGGALAESLAHQRQQALAGDDAQPHAQLVEDDQRRGREGEDPEQLVAVFGAEDRVGGDPGRVVVGEPGQEPRADDGEQGGGGASPEQQMTAPREAPVRVATRGPVGAAMGHGPQSRRSASDRSLARGPTGALGCQPMTFCPPVKRSLLVTGLFAVALFLLATSSSARAADTVYWAN